MVLNREEAILQAVKIVKMRNKQEKNLRTRSIKLFSSKRFCGILDMA